MGAIPLLQKTIDNALPTAIMPEVGPTVEVGGERGFTLTGGANRNRSGTD